MTQAPKIDESGPITTPIRYWVWPGEASKQARRVDWSQRRLRAGLALLPAVALPLAWGAMTDHRQAGIMAASGAVTVGCGAFRPLARYRSLPLLAVLVGMAFSTFAGSIAHQDNWLVSVAVVAVWGWAFGLVTTLGFGAWWLGLQGVIALLVFGGFPADVPTAAGHAGMIVLGGLVELLAVQAVWRLFHVPYEPADAIPRDWLKKLRSNLSFRTPGGRHALRVTLALSIGTLIDHNLRLSHGYWVPMTAAILLKPDFHETIARGLARLAGTLAGAGLATLFTALLRPGPLAMNIALLVAVWGCFALLRVNYALFATCITTYVVFALAAAGLPEPATALYRVEATLIGATIALAAHAIALYRPPAAVKSDK